MVGSETHVSIMWTNPSKYFTGVVIIRKEGSSPINFTDGEIIYNGTNTSFLDRNVKNGVTYYYRIYSYNEKRQLQTIPVVQSITVLHRISVLKLPILSKLYIAEESKKIKYINIGNGKFVRECCCGEIHDSHTTSIQTVISYCVNTIAKNYPSNLRYTMELLDDYDASNLLKWGIGESIYDDRYPASKNFENGVPHEYACWDSADGEVGRMSGSGFRGTSGSHSHGYVPVRPKLDINSHFVQGQPDGYGIYSLVI